MLAPWRTIPQEPVVDNRPRCPKCGERLEDDPKVAPWCWHEIVACYVDQAMEQFKVALEELRDK